ncbi:MAG TPA: hypothetical protein PKN61_12765 [Acidobacteriota bacterium]|jgi:hypothetical protein|nr:hypothetical protein [Acidobacteriota bacterium]HNR39897.1 hypothetical protein [Acidobacteriota bacterium]HNT99045.1 hypothetical protein [Acidobacteriota bacterium]HPB28832.1 hypothetical protein [Acidobacteriota bacterium]HQO26285.1 hypothetical protein [Acidobacteriota bacterium]
MGGVTMYPNLHVWLDRIDALLGAAPADDRVKDARRAAGILRQMLTPPAPDRPAGNEARAEGVRLIYLLGWIKAGVAAGRTVASPEVATAAERAVTGLETVLGSPEPSNTRDCAEYMSRPSPCPPARPGI